MEDKNMEERIHLEKSDVLDIVKRRCSGTEWEEIGEAYNIEAKVLLKEIQRILFYPKQKKKLDYDTPLAKWMKENGVGYKEMERRTGYSYRTIYSVVCNRYRVSRDALECISQITGIPIDKLYRVGMPAPEKKARKNGKSNPKEFGYQ